MDVDGPLLQSAGRDQWRTGSAVEVFSNSDQQWHVGWIVAEDPGGALRVLFDDRSPTLKSKLLSRRDAKLAAVGANVRRLPPHAEVVGTGCQVIAHKPTGRQCATLEEVWALHFEVYLRPHVQSSTLQPGAQGGACGACGAGHTAPVPSHMQSSASMPIGRLGLDPDASQSLGVLGVTRLSEDLAHSEARRLAAEEHARQLEVELERCRAELAHFAQERDALVAERDTARQQLADAGREARPAVGPQPQPQPQSSPRTRGAPVEILTVADAELARSNGGSLSAHSHVSASELAAPADGGLAADAAGAQQSQQGPRAPQAPQALNTPPSVRGRERQRATSPSAADGGERQGPSSSLQSLQRAASPSLQSPGSARGLGRLQAPDWRRPPPSQRPAPLESLVEVRISVPRALTPDEYAEMGCSSEQADADLHRHLPPPLHPLPAPQFAQQAPLVNRMVSAPFGAMAMAQLPPQQLAQQLPHQQPLRMVTAAASPNPFSVAVAPGWPPQAQQVILRH